MEEIWSSSQALEFSYVRILKLLYSEDDVVRWVHLYDYLFLFHLYDYLFLFYLFANSYFL